MGDQWFPVPRLAPFRCFRTGSSDPGNGPFFEFDGWFLNGDGFREEKLYVSAAFTREMLRADGSPFVDPWLELERLRTTVSELEAALEEARQAAEAEAGGYRGDVVNPVTAPSAEVVAAAVADELDRRKQAADSARMERARAGRRRGAA